MAAVLLQGKLLLLITNSDYEYTNCMMSFAYDRYLEAEGMQWRDLFDMVRCTAYPLLSPLLASLAVCMCRPSTIQACSYAPLADLPTCWTGIIELPAPLCLMPIWHNKGMMPASTSRR